MAHGIVRKIDYLGRITIPMEYRKTFSIANNDSIGIYLTDGIIRLVKDEKGYRGMARGLDDLGRLTLPKEIRRTLGFEDCQAVDIYVDGDEICIEKMVIGCIVCQATEELLVTKDFNICRKHAYMVVDAAMED